MACSKVRARSSLVWGSCSPLLRAKIFSATAGRDCPDRSGAVSGLLGRTP